MDKWALSSLHSLVKKVTALLNDYDITTSARAIQDFSDALSNWYVRRGRDRYWGGGMTEDKAAAYTTLYTVLVTLAKLVAPYMPFMAEMMYQNLVPAFYPNAPLSVHLCKYPEADEAQIDFELERGMGDVLTVVNLGRAARGAGNIKNRQPLKELVVASENPLDVHDELKAVVLDELNVKSYRALSSAEELVSYKLKPQLRTLGPKYGKQSKEITEFLNTCNAAKVVKTLKEQGEFKIPNGDVVLVEEDLQIFTESAEGYVIASDRGVTVALDTRLNEELLLEGSERELVSKIQTMRKEAGFEVVDRIEIYYANAEGRAEKVLQKGAFANDVLAIKIAKGRADGYAKSLDINGDKAMLTIVKISK